MMDNKYLAVIYKCKHVMSVHLGGVDRPGGVPVNAQHSCLDCGHILLLIARRIVVDSIRPTSGSKRKELGL